MRDKTYSSAPFFLSFGPPQEELPVNGMRLPSLVVFFWLKPEGASFQAAVL